eukprot:PhF_6_TR7934/c0_g1_i1/m.11923
MNRFEPVCRAIVHVFLFLFCVFVDDALAVDFTVNPTTIFKGIPFTLTLSFVPLEQTVGKLCLDTACSASCGSTSTFSTSSATFVSSVPGVWHACIKVGSLPYTDYGALIAYEITFSPLYVIKDVPSVLTFPNTIPNPMKVALNRFSTCTDPFETGFLDVVDYQLLITRSDTVAFYVCAYVNNVFVNAGSFGVYSGFAVSPTEMIRYDQTVIEIGGSSPSYTRVKVATDSTCKISASGLVRTGGLYGKTATIMVPAPPNTYTMCIEVPPDSNSFASGGNVVVRAFTFSPSTFIADRESPIRFFPYPNGVEIGATVFAASDFGCLQPVNTAKVTVADSSGNGTIVSNFLVSPPGIYYICHSYRSSTHFIPLGNITIVEANALGILSVTPPVQVRGIPFTLRLKTTTPQSSYVKVTTFQTCKDDTGLEPLISGSASLGLVTFVVTRAPGNYHVCVTTADGSEMYSVFVVKIEEYDVRFQFLQVGIPSFVQLDNRTTSGVSFYFSKDSSCLLDTKYVYLPPPNVNFIGFSRRGTHWFCLEGLPNSFKAIHPVFVTQTVLSLTTYLFSSIPETLKFSSNFPNGSKISLSRSLSGRCEAPFLAAGTAESFEIVNSQTAPVALVLPDAEGRHIVPLTVCASFPSNTTNDVSRLVPVGNMTIYRFQVVTNVFRRQIAGDVVIRGPYALVPYRGVAYAVPGINARCPANKSWTNITTINLKSLRSKNVTFPFHTNWTICLVLRDMQISVGFVRVYPFVKYSTIPLALVSGLPFTLVFPAAELVGSTHVRITADMNCNKTLFRSAYVTPSLDTAQNVLMNGYVPPGKIALCTSSNTTSLFNGYLTFNTLKVFPHSVVLGIPVTLNFLNFDVTATVGRTSWLSAEPHCHTNDQEFLPFRETTFMGLKPGKYYACYEGVPATPPIIVTAYFTAIAKQNPIRYAVPFAIQITSDAPSPMFYVRLRSINPCSIKRNFTLAPQGSTTITLRYPVGATAEVCVMSSDKTMAAPTGIFVIMPYHQPTVALAGLPIQVISGYRRSGYAATSSNSLCNTINFGSAGLINYMGQVTVSFPKGLSTQYYCEKDSETGAWEVMGQFTVVQSVTIAVTPQPIIAGLPFKSTVTSEDIVNEVLVANDTSCKYPIIASTSLSPDSSVILTLPAGKRGRMCIKSKTGEWLYSGLLSPVRYVMSPMETLVGLPTWISFTPTYIGPLAVSKKGACTEIGVVTNNNALSFVTTGRNVVCAQMPDTKWYPLSSMWVIQPPEAPVANGGGGGTSNDTQSNSNITVPKVFVGIPFRVTLSKFRNETGVLVFLAPTEACSSEVVGGERRPLMKGFANFTLPSPGFSVVCVVTPTGHIWNTETNFTSDYFFYMSGLPGEAPGTMTLARHVERWVTLPNGFRKWGLGVALTNLSAKHRRSGGCDAPDFIPYVFASLNGSVRIYFDTFLMDDVQLVLCASSPDNVTRYSVGKVNAKAQFTFSATPSFVFSDVTSTIYLSQDTYAVNPIFTYAPDCLSGYGSFIPPVLSVDTPASNISSSLTIRMTFSSRSPFIAMRICWRNNLIGVMNILPTEGMQIPMVMDNCNPSPLLLPLAVFGSVKFILIASDTNGCCNPPTVDNIVVGIPNSSRYVLSSEQAKGFLNTTASLCFVNETTCAPFGRTSVFYDVCETDAPNITNISLLVFVGGAVSLESESFRTAVAVGIACLVVVSIAIVIICYIRSRSVVDPRVVAVAPTTGGGGVGSMDQTGVNQSSMYSPHKTRWDGMFQAMFDPSQEVTLNTTIDDTTVIDRSGFPFQVDNVNVTIENEGIQVEIMEEERSEQEQLFQFMLPFCIEADRHLQVLFVEEDDVFTELMRNFELGIEIIRLCALEESIRRSIVSDGLEALYTDVRTCSQEARILAVKIERMERERRQMMHTLNIQQRNRQLHQDESTLRQELQDMQRDESVQILLLERQEKEIIAEKLWYIEQQAMLLDHQRALREVQGATTPSVFGASQIRNDSPMHNGSTHSSGYNTLPRLDRLRMGGMRLMEHFRSEE